MKQDPNKKDIAGFLAMALDLEDRMSGSVYGDYLEKDMWPVSLKEESFETIKKLLMTLIDGTEKHKKEFLKLRNKL